MQEYCQVGTISQCPLFAGQIYAVASICIRIIVYSFVVIRAFALFFIKCKLAYSLFIYIFCVLYCSLENYIYLLCYALLLSSMLDEHSER